MKRSALLCLCVGFFQAVVAQNTISTLELDDFMDENGTYPYSFISGERNFLYKSHDPSLRMSENEFMVISRPSETRDRRREMTVYNVLLEEVWKQEFELRDEEAIFHSFVDGDNLVLLSSEYDNKQKLFRILVRRFDRYKGDPEDPDILTIFKSKREEAFSFERSPNDSVFVLYQYRNTHSPGPVRYFMDFQQTDDAPGYRADRVSEVAFQVYSQKLERLDSDTVKLGFDKKNRPYVMGAWIDNSQHFYVATLSKDQSFSVIQQNANSQKQTTLRYDNFPKFWREEDVYNLHFPPLIGEGEKLYIPIATREKEKRIGRQIEEIKVLCFDFVEGEVDQRRRIEVGPSLLVAVSKAREEWGAEPLEKFDEYLFRELIPTPSGGLMLIMQRFSISHHINGLFRTFHGFSDLFPSGAPAIQLEEILMITFDQEGNLGRMYNVPSHQQITVPVQLLGMHFSYFVDWKNNKMYFLTHENEGEKFSKPMRLYFRELDLETGVSTERTQVFDHKRRYHFFSRPHTVWLNENIVASMVHVTSSLSSKTYWVTIAF